MFFESFICYLVQRVIVERFLPNYHCYHHLRDVRMFAQLACIMHCTGSDYLERLLECSLNIFMENIEHVLPLARAPLHNTLSQFE